MKILYVANVIGDVNSGAGGIILSLGEQHKKLGHSVDYIFRGSLPFFKKDNVIVRGFCFLTFPFILLFILPVIQTLRKYDIITIISGDGFLYSIINKLLFYKNRPLIAVYSFGLEHIYFEYEKKEEKIIKIRVVSLRHKFFFTFLRLWEVRLSMELCDLIMVLTEREKEYIEKRFGLKNRVYVVRGGVSETFFEKKNAERKKDILFVGAWTHRKGKDNFVKICPQLLQRWPSLGISILGTGVEREKVLSEFPPDLRDNINVIKYLPRERLIEEYQRHRIFLYPAIFEPYGLVIVEAMASGMAIVASETVGACELIADGYNGFLAQPKDIEKFVELTSRLWEDGELCKKLGENAHKSASYNTWEAQAKTFITICERYKNGKKI